MHIAFLIPDLRGGGAQKMLINLANWFAVKGHKTELVLFNDAGSYADLISDRVTVRNLNKSRSFMAIPALRRYLTQHQPDVLFSALYYVNIIAVISSLLARTHTKIIISERNHLSRSMASFTALRKMMWRRCVKLLYPKSDRIIGISNGVCDDLRRLLPKQTHPKVSTVYNPVVTDEFSRKLVQDVSSIFPQDASPKLVASGRLVAQKDYPTMLKAFALYLKTSPTAYLAVLGTGNLDDNIHAMAVDMGIDDRVVFMGFVDNPLAYMHQADLFLMTSAWEGFGNVIVEALYCGLKIVSTDCPSGPSEILDRGTYGTLCPVGAPQEIAQALIGQEATPLDPEAQKARALDFHVDVIGQNFTNIFNDVTRADHG